MQNIVVAVHDEMATSGPLGPYSPPYVWTWDAHNVLLVVMLVLALGLALWTLAGCRLPDAAYGKFATSTGYSRDWMNVDGRFAWWLMESPSVWAAFVFFFVVGTAPGESPPNRFEPAPLVMFALYEFHYVQRSCIYPFFLKDEGKSVSAVIILASMVYNTINSYLQVSFLSTFGVYPVSWLYDPRFIIGTVFFLTGYVINRHSDYILHTLRRPSPENGEEDGNYDAGESAKMMRENDRRRPDDDVEMDAAECFVHPVTKKEYRVPRGGMFEYVSAANYFGELTIWFGFAMLTWSLEGLSFFLLTFGNLAPRALRYHEFYMTNFPNTYPKLKRKALIPFLF